MAILKTGKEIGVCVHHSVYKPANNLAELKAQATLFNGWHKSKSWAETTKTPGEYPYISYHYLMATDGSILNVTDEKYVKYHAGDNFRKEGSFNLHGTAVCLTGNYQNDVPTDAQMKALVAFIRDYQKRYKIDAFVRGHKETSQDPTACPGTNLGTSKSGWLKQVIANVNNSAYPPVEPPQPPQQTECQKEVERLKEENTHLTGALGASQEGLKNMTEELRLVNERVDFLESTMAIRDKELSDLENDYKRVLEERNRFEQEKLVLELELDSLKKPHWTEELRDRIYELWEQYKEKIISFIKRK